jgi:NAD(P)H-dependent FMN reductase
MQLLAISGSLRSASTNTAVLEALSRLAPVGVEIVIYREMGALPHFNPDDDGDTPPAG